VNNCEASSSGASGLQIFLLQFYVFYSEILTVLLTTLVFVGWEINPKVTNVICVWSTYS